MAKQKYIECGKIINTHGTDGAVKLDCWCDDPQILAGLSHIFVLDGDNYTKIKIIRASVFKQFVLMWLDGIDNIDKAAACKEKVVYALREEILVDNSSYFIVDLIGLPVIDEISGNEYGTLSDVFNPGSSDIYVIKTINGEKMIPAVKEYVKRIDPDKGIYIVPIEGMFD